MALDRTGDDSGTQHHCRNGWNGEDEQGRPIPCLICRPHLWKTMSHNDYSETVPSARAQQAIERDNRQGNR